MTAQSSGNMSSMWVIHLEWVCDKTNQRETSVKIQWFALASIGK